ncbi:MAG: GNVR domain-containing protein [Bacteroidota bacterium]
MTLQQYLPVFWERRRLITSVYLFTVIMALIISLWLPKQYVASVSLLIDVKNDPIVGTVLPDMTSQNYMANQVEIVHSDRVAARVIKLLGQERWQTVMEMWQSDKDNEDIPFETYYAKWLKHGLKVKTSPINNVMTISFTGQDPQFVADIANAFSQAYSETAVDLRVEPARQAAAWYEERLNSLRSTLKQAKSKLSDYQKEKGILASEAHHDQETELLTALTAKLAEVQKRRIDGGTHPAGGDESSPVVQENAAIRDINSELRKARTKLSEMSVNTGSNYPPRRQLESQIASLKQQLNEEIGRLPGAGANARRISAQQEAALNALIAAQQNKMLGQLSQHDDIAMLTNDVETAQHAYDAVAQRGSQMNLESKLEQANVSVLTPAQVPNEPSRPKVLLNFLISHPIGLMLGLLLAIGMESLDRRVRSVHDLAYSDDLPMLGTLRREPRRYSRLNELLSDAIASPRSLPFKGTE